MKKTDVNILIIEDDKSVLDSISEAVKRKGYRAIAVTKPDEAESIVKIKPIHGVICDVMLPGRNGIDRSHYEVTWDCVYSRMTGTSFEVVVSGYDEASRIQERECTRIQNELNQQVIKSEILCRNY